MDKQQTHKIDRYFYFFEKSFSIFALIYYSSSVLTLIQVDYAIFATIEKLIYHAVTLLTFLLLLIHWRKLIPALKKVWPLLIVIAFVTASIFWSDLPSLSTQKSLQLIRYTCLGLYLGIRFDLREYLSILSIAFIITRSSSF